MCKNLGNNVYECNGTCSGGTVWGSGIYTGDSNIWLAAKHMGYLPGSFTKIDGPGLLGYIGTSRNGVTTVNYGTYGTSYYLHKGAINPKDLQLQNIHTDILKSVKTQVQSLTATQKKLVTIINDHENKVKELHSNIGLKQKQLLSLEEKIRSQVQILSNESKKIKYQVQVLSKQNIKVQSLKNQQKISDIQTQIMKKQPMQMRSSAVNINEEILSKMKDLYTGQMRRYNQNLQNMLNTKNYLSCFVCLDKKREALLFPCNHASYCNDCVKDCLLNGKCKICQANVQGFINFKLDDE